MEVCMARLKPVSQKDAPEDVRNIFSAMEKKMGVVPNVFKYMGNSVPLLKGYLAIMELCNATSLSPKLREQISLVVSQKNNCHYCLSAHSAISKNLGLKEKEIIDARKGESSDPKSRAVLQFSKKFIEKKGFVDDQDVNQLKNAGVSDAEVGDILLTIISTIYTNYFNHLNDTPNDFPEAVRLEEVTVSR